MQIKCVVACDNSEGIPDFFPCVVECSQEEYDEGNHYDSAREMALDANYGGKMVVYDENDGPEWLFKQLHPADTM